MSPEHPEPASRDARTGNRDGDTENRILDAARTVFLRRGTAGARMREIAEEAGVNPALLHYYFRSKEALAEAVFRRAARQLFPSVAAVLRSDAPLEEKVREVIRLEIDHLSENPFLPGYILSELNLHPDRAPQFVEELLGEPPDRSGSEIMERLGEQIEIRVEAGEMRPIPPAQFVVNLIALCIFPFAARPMLRAALGLGDEEFPAFIRERKRTLPDFFLGAMAP